MTTACIESIEHSFVGKISPSGGVIGILSRGSSESVSSENAVSVFGSDSSDCSDSFDSSDFFNFFCWISFDTFDCSDSFDCFNLFNSGGPITTSKEAMTACVNNINTVGNLVSFGDISLSP